jgi:hypothetical protein
MQTMPANGAWKNSALRDTANTPGLGVAAGDYHRPLDLSAEFPATVSETPRVVGDIGRLSSRPNRAGRQPAFPRCSGGEVGVRRPRTAKASVQSTNSRGYLLVGQNIRAEWRSFITCSRSNMSHLPLHFSLGSLGSHVHPTGESPRLKKCRWGREWLPYREFRWCRPAGRSPVPVARAVDPAAAGRDGAQVYHDASAALGHPGLQFLNQDVRRAQVQVDVPVEKRVVGLGGGGET